MYALLCCLPALVSCQYSMVNGTKRIKPSQNIVKETYGMQAFNKIEVDAVANVKFIQTDETTHQVVLSCPDNYVDLFSLKVKGDKLYIGFVKGTTNIESKNVDITVYAPQLRSLENSGVASVEIDRLVADELEVENSGVGSIYLSGLQVTRLEAECSGVGSIELAGQTDRADLECSGVGSIKAKQLKARLVKAEVSGVGGIKCHATESITADVSGVGSLTYSGNPEKKSLNRSGVGGIHAE